MLEYTTSVIAGWFEMKSPLQPNGESDRGYLMPLIHNQVDLISAYKLVS